MVAGEHLDLLLKRADKSRRFLAGAAHGRSVAIALREKLEVARAAHHVLPWIPDVRHPHRAGRGGHQLHQTLRPRAGHDIGIEIRFGSNHGTYERLGNSIAGLLIANRVVVACVARGRRVSRGHQIGGSAGGGCLARTQAKKHLPPPSHGLEVGKLHDAVVALARPNDAATPRTRQRR